MDLLNRVWKNRIVQYIWGWLKHYVGGLYNRFDDHHIFLLAGGLAFSIFVCIIPMLLIIFALIGAILERHSVTDEITVIIDRLIPYQDYAAFVKEKVFARIDEFRLYKGVAGIVGMIGMFFASSGLFSSMRTILNTVYRVRRKETALIGKLHDFGLVLLVLLYFLLSVTILPSLEIVRGFADNLKILAPFRYGVVEDFSIATISFIIIFFAFYVMYWLVPHRRRPQKVILVSAISASVLWEVAKQLFGFYITNALTLRKIYGAYVLIIVVAFWVYYTSIVFIIGAEIGQLFRERMSWIQMRRKAIDEDIQSQELT
nr:YihY/virulence factor BrkB family protein [candidate division Zixibacteria bacterium]